MESVEKNEELGVKNIHKNKVHKVLAYSHLSFFILFLIGLFFDYLFPLKIFDENNVMFSGFLFLLFGTLLIFWAQKSSLKLQKENISKDSFYRGPYRYTRSPTHFGLFFIMIGFGFNLNSFFIVVFSIVYFILTRFIFVRKQENILEEKYGDPYSEYKKLVRF